VAGVHDPDHAAAKIHILLSQGQEFALAKHRVNCQLYYRPQVTQVLDQRARAELVVFPRTFVRLRPRKVSLLDDVGQPRRSHRNSDLLPLEDAIANFDLGLLRLSLGARLLNSAAVTVAIDHEFVVVVFVGASRLAPTNLSITLYSGKL